MFFELSFTRRKALACPYYFQQLYGKGESTASQMDAQAGTIGHELLGEYILHLQRGHRQRDTEWLVDRFNKAMEGQHEYIRNFLEDPIARFMNAYSRRREVKSLVEQEFWVKADGTPMQQLQDGEMLLCDCYHGRADLIEIEYGGEKATIFDHKLGFDRSYLGLHSQNNEQLMGYCWCYLMHHPECQTIVGAICPWRWTTTPIYGSWSRDHLNEIMQELLAKDFATIHRLYEERGSEPWPAEPDYNKVCRWCMLGCPDFKGEE